MKLSPFVEAAHDYAALGLAVFPLRPRDKKPYGGTNGLSMASLDVFEVVGWWTGKTPLQPKARPEGDPEPEPVFASERANIGVATGPASGFWVLDIDGPAGLEAFVKLANTYGRVPDTVRQRTGNGYHLCFAWTPGIRNSAKKIGAGLDIRGDGGYIVVPPSIHPSGRTYTWDPGRSPFEQRFAQAPAWLTRLLTPRDAPATPSAASYARHAPISDRYVDAALDGACRAIAQAPPGTQNDTLHSRAYSVGRLVAAGRLAPSVARQALVAAGLAMSNGNPRQPWTARDIERGVDHALARASSNPKETTR